MSSAKKLSNEPNFAPVKVAKQVEGQNGEIKIVRASKFEELGIKSGTVVAQGLYEKKEKNKFDDKKFDYFLRGNDGTLYILNETYDLRQQMDELNDAEGANVRITYSGTVKTKAGKEMHTWEVAVAL